MARHAPESNQKLGKLKNPLIVSDISHYYLNGLYDQRVLAQLKMSIAEIPLDKLAARTRAIASALGEDPGRAVRSVETKIEETDDLSLTKRIEAIMKKNVLKCAYCSKEGHLESRCFLKKRHNESRKEHMEAVRGGGKKINKSQDRCFNCNTMGHWSKDCVKPRVQGQQRGGGKGSGEGLKCRRCGRFGHIAAKCRVQLGRQFKK